MAKDLIVGEPGQLVSFSHCENNRDKCYETNIKPIMDEIKNLAKAVSEFKIEIITTMAEMPEKILEKAETKFASKTTEKLVNGLVVLILVAFVGALVVIVMPRQNQLTSAEVKALIEANNDKFFEPNYPPKK